MNANSRSKFRSSQSTWPIVFAIAEGLGVVAERDEIGDGEPRRRSPPRRMIVAPISLGCCEAGGGLLRRRGCCARGEPPAIAATRMVMQSVCHHWY